MRFRPARAARIGSDGALPSRIGAEVGSDGALPSRIGEEVGSDGASPWDGEIFVSWGDFGRIGI